MDRKFFNRLKVIAGLVLIAYMFYGAIAESSGWGQILMIFLAVVTALFFLVVAMTAGIYSKDDGYTRCPKCSHRFKPEQDPLYLVPEGVHPALLKAFDGDMRASGQYWHDRNSALNGAKPAALWELGPRQSIFDDLDRIKQSRHRDS